MITPLSLLKLGFVKAQLEILEPRGSVKIIPFCFNPTEYQLQKANTFAEIPIPGLETPPIQYIRGASEKLTADLLVDTSDTLEDVREKYVNDLRGLMNINDKLHAPPIVRFTWAKQMFKGVMESCNVTYLMFTPEGVPLRAKVQISLKEYRPVEVQLKEPPRSSPDVEKQYVVRRGDTLSNIAAAVYRDASLWREIARANGIRDPRTIDPGRVLILPRVDLRPAFRR
jgi:nucleoid-associated protein YgaU